MIISLWALNKIDWIKYPTFTAFPHTFCETGLTRLSLEVVNPISGRRLPVVVSDLIDFADGCDVRLVDPLVDEDAAPLAQKLTAALADDGANTASQCHRSLIHINLVRLFTRIGVKCSFSPKKWDGLVFPPPPPHFHPLVILSKTCSLFQGIHPLASFLW